MIIFRNRNDFFDKVIFLIITAFIFLFVFFSMQAGGKYIFLGLSLLSFIICIYQNNGCLKLSVHQYQVYTILFIQYIFISVLWAVKPSDTISKGITILEIFVCLYPIYWYIYENEKIDLLLHGIKWGGYLISLYTLCIYGYEGLKNASTAEQYRLTNSFANINAISMVVVVAALLLFWDLAYGRSKWQLPFFLPIMLVVFAGQSRKALLFIILGFVSIIVIKNYDRERLYQSWAKILVRILIFVIIGITLSKFEFFQGSMDRFISMLNLYSGEGKVDHSAVIRNELVKLGIRGWLEHPLKGMGIGCSHILVDTYLENDFYLHNNFVELLSGGGIIGFMLYYSLHVSLLISLLKYRKKDRELFCIIITWVLLIIVTDYGVVSYYSKSQWLYLMTACLAVKKMEKKENISPHEISVEKSA